MIVKIFFFPSQQDLFFLLQQGYRKAAVATQSLKKH